MLRIIQNSNSGSAKSYYTQADYYSEGQELAGLWQGKGAEMLGLRGVVQREHFDALCDNLHPFTGERLTVRTKSERRVGYDFNFHVPKSVSVLYGLTQDQGILDAFRAAVHETMQDMEQEMKARVRDSKQQRGDRVTGNMVWSEFVHLTARPVAGMPDPHLHAHCFVFNATFDAQEGRWKAGQFGDLKRDASYFEAVFHSRLGKKLSEQGYIVERTRKGWELGGVPGSVVRKFSRRTAQIEKTAAELGLTEDAAKDQLGARTRESKQKDLSMRELRGWWDSVLTGAERAALQAVHQRQIAQLRAGPSADQAMAQAVLHCFERESVVAERKLLREALRLGVGSVRVGDLRRQLGRHGLIPKKVDERWFYTTRTVLAEEERAVRFAGRGRGVCRPLGGEGHVFQRDWLDEGQKAAVRHVLESTDRVMLIRGAAGAGKTKMMQEAVEAIEANGKNVIVLAPSADASRGVLREEGFAEADTVARFLQDEDMQREAAGQVLWVDEAGLLGIPTMGRLFDLADRLGARVVLSGDRRQHAPVERGAALRLLEEHAGLKPAEVTDIKRQKGHYKRAVSLLAEGKTAEGFAALDGLGAIREVSDGTREQQLAADYVGTVREGKSALVVSPTHAEGNRITGTIRARLRAEGKLDGREEQVVRFENLSLTEAERADPVSYEPGMAVQFHQNAPGFRRGERLAVVGRDGNGAVVVRSPKGQERALPLHLAGRFQVYQADTLPLAPGDRVRVTANGYTRDKHRLNNGALFTVQGFTRAGDIVLDTGWVVPKDYGHLAHGYVVTSHAAQGKTVDRVFIGQASESFPATSREQFYVSASRAREQMVLYTDNKAALKEAVKRSDPRLSATELFGAGPETSGQGRARKHVALLRRLAALGRDLAARAAEQVKERIQVRELAYER